MLTQRLSTFVLLLAFVQTAFGGVCEFSDGNYKLQWSVDSKNTVNFTLTYRNYPANLNSWTGVAFGEGMMNGLDAIIVRNSNGKITLTDSFVQGYGPANSDPTENLKVDSTRLNNGALMAKFSRPANTGDKQADMDISNCMTWQFITSLNPSFGTHTGKHLQTPIPQKVCLNKCKA